MKTNPSLSDVAARREQLEAEIEARKLELSELAFAERVLKRLGEYMPPVRVEPAGGGVTLNSVSRPIPPRPPPPPPLPPLKVEAYTVDPTKESVESLILIVLGASDRVWWTANELQSELTVLKGAEVPMSTISPTLSNMKGTRKIVRDGMKVADPKRAGWQTDIDDLIGVDKDKTQNENGEAKASPETGELAGSPNDSSA
ncbi:hypothetical protein EOC93_02395 [Mesorhizobium sp. M6A.T.Ce.TU.002.03.1.1]|uniref:hypothetical protein n=1 Tax=unclassified Mesorhizobium TaxID=325217 RepID=UPI000FCAF4F7|nr:MULTISPECIES: hypothetical protein [unclassified Mesorhizobium]RUU46640.1 hypothetical protein EOC93_02395 [Mesorhizobium sp. M6A.T.Ce.TU.002.03.1.1]RWP65556.1 MAG: hypothetical protein EOR09_33525 [Mesorhizobium sp.]